MSRDLTLPARARISGKLMLPGSSRMIDAVLYTAPGQFTVTDDSETVRASGDLAQLRFETPIGRAPRRVTLPDGALFETSEHAALDALNPSRGAKGLHGAEAFRPRLIGFVALTLLAAFVVWRYGLALLVSAAVWITPPQFARVIDDQTLAVFDRVMLQPTTLDAAEQARLQADFVRLAEALAASEAHTPLRLEFRSGPIGPNAFAMPGGTVILTDDLVRLADDPDMVAGVMGHEIGHVTHRHSLRQIYRALGIATLVGFLAGETGPVLEAILLEGNLLLQLAYSREHEFEADAFAVEITHRAGFDPEGMIRFFEHLTEMGLVDPMPSWGSTHPPHDERVAAIRAQIAALPAR
ncbi:M48 family metallopeptidase [Natronohydrobacter thiooxidans]|uniref:M48 family metallopeptidase n=1 Tax=Natronohydrobacter thiooxidans TaxID=87172 RepID=UPI000B12B635|nr:M48 family metallopeptidase [Natronohydrobacter thiooxidans]